MIIDEEQILYPAEPLVIIKGINKFYGLSDGKIRDINKSAEKILLNIKEGTSFINICEKLSLDTNQQKEKLRNFIIKLINEKLIGLTPSLNGRIVFKEIKTNPFLTRIFMETTEKCNLKCKHCYIGDNYCKNELKMEEIKNVIKEASELGVIQFDITGGEFFTRHDAKEILKACAENNLIVNIFTNGTLINDEICRLLKSLGNVHMIYVSLDDDNEIDHDTFRGISGAYKATINGIKLLKKYDLPVTINLIINQKNHLRIDNIINYFNRTLDVKCRVAPILYIGRGKCLEDEKLSVEEIGSAIDKCCKSQQVDLKKYFHQESNREISSQCGVGNSMLFIKSDGEICLCPTLTSDESECFNFGNIRSISLKEAWTNSDKLKSLRKLSCKIHDCKYKAICKNGCRSRAFLSTGDIFGKDPVPCYYLHHYIEN